MRACIDCKKPLRLTWCCDDCFDRRIARDGEAAVLAQLAADVEAAHPGIQLRPRVKKMEMRETAAQRKQRERRHKWGRGTRLWTDNA